MCRGGKKSKRHAIDALYKASKALGYKCPAGKRKKVLGRGICLRLRASRGYMKAAKTSPSKHRNALTYVMYRGMGCRRRKVTKGSPPAFTPGLPLPSDSKPSDSDGPSGGGGGGDGEGSGGGGDGVSSGSSDGDGDGKKDDSSSDGDGEKKDSDGDGEKKDADDSKDKPSSKSSDDDDSKPSKSSKSRSSSSSGSKSSGSSSSSSPVPDEGDSFIARINRDGLKNFRKNNTYKKCKRGNERTTWRVKYDACDVFAAVVEKCRDNDGRWGYDALWDASRLIGCNCGESQYFYQGMSWENFCPRIDAVMKKIGDTGRNAGRKFNPVEYCITLGCTRIEEPKETKKSERRKRNEKPKN
ncbi:hypothetical protein HDU96_005063 [Phlyctochytrium bullatum]|nr:hypothetical protein HDU96_005063 [Phlyctochytrium bullatum]